MTYRAKVAAVTDEDVCFQIKGEWYLVPFYILNDLADELAISDEATAEKLNDWLLQFDKSYLYLESILQHYGHLLRSFILYTLDDT
jgi:hypothetical protein